MFNPHVAVPLDARTTGDSNNRPDFTYDGLIRFEEQNNHGSRRFVWADSTHTDGWRPLVQEVNIGTPSGIAFAWNDTTNTLTPPLPKHAVANGVYFQQHTSPPGLIGPQGQIYGVWDGSPELTWDTTSDSSSIRLNWTPMNPATVMAYHFNGVAGIYFNTLELGGTGAHFPSDGTPALSYTTQNRILEWIPMDTNRFFTQNASKVRTAWNFNGQSSNRPSVASSGINMAGSNHLGLWQSNGVPHLEFNSNTGDINWTPMNLQAFAPSSLIDRVIAIESKLDFLRTSLSPSNSWPSTWPSP
jgi:hypothetical protein